MATAEQLGIGGSSRRRRRRKPKPKPAPVTTPSAILGGKGVKATSKARRSYDRTARRRRKNELARLARSSTSLSRGERSVLADIDPLLTESRGIFGGLPELHTSEGERRLASRVAGSSKKEEPVTVLEVAEALLTAAPPLKVGGVTLKGAVALARKLAAEGGASQGSKAVAGAARAASKVKGAAKAADQATSLKGAGRIARGRSPRAPSKAPRAAPTRAPSGGKLRKAGRAAGRVAKGTGKAATFPIRHPLKTAKFQALAQAPVVATTENKDAALKDLLETGGVGGDIARTVGSAVAGPLPGEVAENIAKDAFDLPANAVPALYMPAAAAVEYAAKGDDSRAKALIEDYKKSGLIPAALSGDPDRVLESLKKHPLFGALEARGVQAVAGRAGGAVARSGALGPRAKQAGSTERKPLRLPGRLEPKERSYSRDIIEKSVQVAFDKRRKRKQGGQKASPGEVSKILRERVDRIAGQEEGARRGVRDAEAQLGAETRPSRGPAREAGVGLATIGVLRSAETFAADVATYAGKLDRAAARMEKKLGEASGEQRALLNTRLKQNRRMRKLMDDLKGADPEEIFTSARANAGRLQEVDRELAGAFDNAAQLEQARLIPAARIHLEAKHGLSNKTRSDIDALKAELEGATGREAGAIRGRIRALKAKKQLVDRNGEPLSGERLTAELRRAGVDPDAVGFVSQAPSARGPGSFYRAFFGDRQTLSKGKKRSGKAVEEGLLDPSFDAVVEQRIRGAGIVSATKGFDRTVREFSVEGRRFKDWNEAQEAVRDPAAFGLPEGMDLKPVRLAPLRAGSRETARAEEIFEMVDPANPALEATADSILKAATSKGEGPVVLLPAEVVARLGEHFKSAATGRKVAQLLSSTFKGVVLPLSPNWYAGNFLDVSIRTALYGTGPYGRNAALGRRVVREIENLDPDYVRQATGGLTPQEAAARVRAALVPGTLFGAAEATRVFRDARQFAGTSLAPLARRLAALRRTPGPKQVVGAYVRFRDAAFKFNEIAIERQAQYALLGKVARQEVRSKTGEWHKALILGDDAVRDLAKGLLKTPAQIKFAKGIEESLGQWTANSPAMREFLVDYAPFGMWTRAATRFTLLTLPAKHPIKTAIAAAAYEMTAEEREKLGLSHFAEMALPANLQGSIPTGDGGLISPQSLTTLGFFADYQASLANTFFPQFPLAELAGLDWTGDRLTDAEGRPLRPDGRAAATFLAMGEAYLPFMGLAKRVSEGGPEALIPRAGRPYDPGLVDWLLKQSQSRTITVPAGGSSSEDENPWAGSGSSDNPWAAGSAEEDNPWAN